VLAVAEGALAVLPGLPPVDRGQAHQDGARGQFGRQGLPQLAGAFGADLQGVLAGGIVGHYGRLCQSLHGAADQVALGGVQVAAGGVDAQGPARISGLLPGREGQAVEEELGYAVAIQRHGREIAGGKGLVIEGPVGGRDLFQLDEPGTPVAAKGVGLGRPIQVAGSPGKPARVVFRRLVIV
jgi:hypothetical protein